MIPVLIVCAAVLFCVENARAEHQEFKVIKELQKAEKSEGPIMINVPSISYDAEGSKNPFQGYIEEELVINPNAKPGEEKVVLPNFEIKGVVWGSSTPQVIINNKVLKVGDEIEGAKISAITKDAIILIYRERKYSLITPSAATVESLDQAEKLKESNIKP